MPDQTCCLHTVEPSSGRSTELRSAPAEVSLFSAGSAGEAQEKAPGYALLVIGIGSELCGDDAAGRIVADEIERLLLPGVEALSCQQLFPELSELVSRARMVVIADARIDSDPEAAIQFQPAPAMDPAMILSHSCSPSALAALAGALYGAQPSIMQLTVPGSRFGVGDGISEATRRAIGCAVDCIVRFATANARGERTEPVGDMTCMQ